MFDDFPNLVANTSIHLSSNTPAQLYAVLSTPQPSGSMRGLPTLTFALDYWRAGGMADPTTFKITNIAIHALTAFALAWLYQSLLLAARIPAQRAAWIAPLLALAWATHPLQVSTVLYAVQRLQALGTLFLVLALLAYLRARQAQTAGRPARADFLLTGLLWALALGCKEDSVLLPAYALALELTVLRFAAAGPHMGLRLRRGWLATSLLGAGIYALWIVPHFWSTSPYPGRDFNSAERLLTQARVLCLYLWEILLPLPSHMPFYYDWIVPSRGLLQPWTTLPAIALIGSLLAFAWRLRHRRPLFALGVFLFFSAHFVTSNVIGLEMAFEHRNHFALIGAVLAAYDALFWAGHRLRISPHAQAAVAAAALLGLGGATLSRAHDWRGAIPLARSITQAAPGSSRAWNDLCLFTLKAGGGIEAAHNPRLDEAIDACASGANADPKAISNLAMLLALKSARGDATPADWQRFQRGLGAVPMTLDNARTPFVLAYYAGLGVPMDKQQIRQALDLMLQRTGASPEQLVQAGYAVLYELKQPEEAMPYFVRAIEATPSDDSLALNLAAELQANGHGGTAAHLLMFARERRSLLPDPSSRERQQ